MAPYSEPKERDFEVETAKKKVTRLPNVDTNHQTPKLQILKEKKQEIL